VKIKLLYTTTRKWKPFFNIFNLRREFPVQIWCKKPTFFTLFQLQTATESRKQHWMTWNLAYKSIFMSSTRINHFGMDIWNIAKNQVNVRFFSIFSHSERDWFFIVSANVWDWYFKFKDFPLKLFTNRLKSNNTIFYIC